VRVTGNEEGIKVKNPTGRPRSINQRISNARVKEALIQNQLSSPPAFPSAEP
jgi:hypothetical protein